MSLRLTSFVIAHHGRIPKRYSGDGENLSPPLSWSDAPENVRSFALVCEDPDAPHRPWFHWAIYDIPADVFDLDEGVAHEEAECNGVLKFRQAVNDFGRPGYDGPHPPHGHGVHHYHFQLFALDVPHLPPTAHAGCREVKRAAQQHAIATSELIGTFSR